MSEAIHTSLPEPDSASSVPDAAVPDDAEERVDLSHLPPEHKEVVRQLRAQVQRAVTTIQRLRAENRQLRERVEELEVRPDVPADKTVLALDDDPEGLRKQITEFIEAIDLYLEEGDPPSSDDQTSPSTSESFSSDGNTA